MILERANHYSNEILEGQEIEVEGEAFLAISLVVILISIIDHLVLIIYTK